MIQMYYLKKSVQNFFFKIDTNKELNVSCLFYVRIKPSIHQLIYTFVESISVANDTVYLRNRYWHKFYYTLPIGWFATNFVPFANLVVDPKSRIRIRLIKWNWKFSWSFDWPIQAALSRISFRKYGLSVRFSWRKCSVRCLVWASWNAWYYFQYKYNIPANHSCRGEITCRNFLVTLFPFTLCFMFFVEKTPS